MVRPKSTARLRRSARRRLRAFRDDESGSVIVFTLFILVLMLIVGGMAVDFMRFESRRSKLQGITDRAVLAAADLDQSRDPADVVRDYFVKAGMGSNLKGDPQVSPASLNRREVTAYGELRMNTFFLKLIGINHLTAGSAATAIEGVGNIEISLVIDISGSMREVIPGTTVTRIARLREASTNFVNTLLIDDHKDRVSISLVPYSEHVGIGKDMFALFNMNKLHDFSYCVEFENAAYGGTAIDPTVLREQAQQWQFNPTIDADGDGDWDPGATSGYYIRDIVMPICPTESYEQIVPISQNAALLTGNIAQLTPRAGTSIFLGMKWGVALLDPSMRATYNALPSGQRDAAFAARPVNYATTDAPNNTRKYIVLMSDGQNDNSNRLKASKYNTPSKRAHWAFENFPYYWSTDIQYQTDYSHWMDPFYTASQGDTLLKNICNATKSSPSNITIYTIAMGTDSDPDEDARGKAALSDCASSPSMFYQTSGAELVAIFDDIAEQITDLRLTQ